MNSMTVASSVEWCFCRIFVIDESNIDRIAFIDRNGRTRNFRRTIRVISIAKGEDVLTIWCLDIGDSHIERKVAYLRLYINVWSRSVVTTASNNYNGRRQQDEHESNCFFYPCILEHSDMYFLFYKVVNCNIYTYIYTCICIVEYKSHEGCLKGKVSGDLVKIWLCLCCLWLMFLNVSLLGELKNCWQNLS